MKNSIVRFAIDDDGSLYDYKHKRSHAPVGLLEDGDGVWDLAKVKANIEAGLHIESAHATAAPPVPEQLPVEAPAEVDKVDEANEHFETDPALPPVDPADPVEASKLDFEADGKVE